MSRKDLYRFLLSIALLSIVQSERKISTKSPFSCFKCTHHDKPQEIKEAACMKKFDLSKYTQEECISETGPGKCLKAYEKTEARTKKQIEDDERSVTVRKCVTQGELEYLKNVRGIDTSDGCHTIRSTKTKHKVYCFCSGNLCNQGQRMSPSNSIALLLLLLLSLFFSVRFSQQK